MFRYHPRNAVSGGMASEYIHVEHVFVIIPVPLPYCPKILNKIRPIRAPFPPARIR